MDQILVAGVGDDADHFGTGRLVGQSVVDVPLHVTLVDSSAVSEVIVADVVPFLSIDRHHFDG